MSMRRIAAAAAAAAMAATGVGLVGASPAAASTYTPYYIDYGATYSQGAITWYNRSANVSGVLKAVSGCRWVTFQAYSGDFKKWDYLGVQRCSESASFDDLLNIDVPGGPQHIYVQISVGSNEVREVHCTRDGCSRQYSV